MTRHELRLVVGDELQLAHGVHATVVKFDDDGAVWLNVNQGKTAYGVSKYSLRDVEGALAGKRLAIVAQPTGAERPTRGWQKLPQVVVLTGAAIMCIMIISVVIHNGFQRPDSGSASTGTSSRDERSYQFGRQQSDVARIFWKVSCQLNLCGVEADKRNVVTPEGSCEQLIKKALRGNRPEVQGFVMKDMMEGCLDGFLTEPVKVSPLSPVSRPPPGPNAAPPGGTLQIPSEQQAEPHGSMNAEQHFLAEVDQYLLRPRLTDVVMLRVGYQACAVRRSGRSSDDAKEVIWNTLNEYGSRSYPGAEVGSIVHVAVDNLCPEVGYP